MWRLVWPSTSTGPFNQVRNRNVRPCTRRNRQIEITGMQNASSYLLALMYEKTCRSIVLNNTVTQFNLCLFLGLHCIGRKSLVLKILDHPKVLIFYQRKNSSDFFRIFLNPLLHILEKNSDLKKFRSIITYFRTF